MHLPNREDNDKLEVYANKFSVGPSTIIIFHILRLYSRIIQVGILTKRFYLDICILVRKQRLYT